jgi:hypothetical protein
VQKGVSKRLVVERGWTTKGALRTPLRLDIRSMYYAEYNTILGHVAKARNTNQMSQKKADPEKKNEPSL